MNHWLLKTEPDCYSWEAMKGDGETFWDGIHNYQARNNLRMMKKGDLCFFYHSGEERRVMGIVEVVKEAYPDAEEPVWSWVDVSFVKSFAKPVSLEEMKTYPALAGMKLFKQGRLSVVPVTQQEWDLILSLGGLH